MDMRPCKNSSSHIHSIGFDEETGTLAVKFHRGGVYHYPGVGKDVFDQLHSHESPGLFFHTSIRGRFKGTKR